MKVTIAHADTCIPCYWSGHHRPHVSFPVHRGTRFCDVRQDLRTEIAQGAVMGSDDDAQALAADVVQDPAYAEELTAAVYAAIGRVRSVKRGQRYAFRHLPEDDDSGEGVHAFFVIQVEGERRSLETHVIWPDERARQGEPRAARLEFRDGTSAYIVVGTDYGYVRTTGGDLRVWPSARAAKRFAKAYKEARA